MKAILSTTYDDKYLYFLPIVTWCWNKLGVDVICFMPKNVDDSTNRKIHRMLKCMPEFPPRLQMVFFDAPKHKEATYAQCSRLYAACLYLPEDEVLIIGDIDMANFKVPYHMGGHDVFEIFGHDLVPENQYPMCYISAPVKQWRRAIDSTKSHQENLDLLLGHIECESFRGNYWGKDQETIFNLLKDAGTKVLTNRSNGQNQFAQNRIDRDDTYWRDRLNKDIIDAHLWRDGFTEQNHANIMELLQFMYPEENFEWINEYRNAYLKLI